MVRTDFWEETQSIGAGQSLGIVGMEFHDFDIVPQELHPLLIRCRVQELGHVAPVSDEDRGGVRNPLQGVLTLRKFLQLAVQGAVIRFQPGKFRLHTRECFRPDVFQYFHQPSNIGLRSLLLSAENLFLVTEFFRLRTQAGQRSFDDAFTGLHAAADIPDAAKDRFLDGLGGDAGGTARILAAFMILTGAGVVVVLASPPGGREADHVGTAAAAENSGQQVVSPFRLYFESGAATGGFSQLKLDPVELVFGNDRRVVAIMHRIAPPHLADVDRVAENAGHLLLREQIAASLLARASAVAGVTHTLIAEEPSYGTGRTQFFVRVEDLPHDSGGFVVDLQQSRLTDFRAVAEDVSAIPQAAFHAVPHDRQRAFRRHLSFQLGEDHDELDHRFACRHGRVELLSERNHIDLVVLEECPKVDEILE